MRTPSADLFTHQFKKGKGVFKIQLQLGNTQFEEEEKIIVKGSIVLARLREMTKAEFTYGWQGSIKEFWPV